MKFLDELKIRTQQFLRGRYGSDELNLFLVSFAIFFTFLTLFIDFGIFSLFLQLVPLVIAYARILSKNITKRYNENRQFLQYFNPIKSSVLKYSQRLKHLKSYKYLTCTQCKQNLRVPRGKGKICVTCPKCKTEIHTKS